MQYKILWHTIYMIRDALIWYASIRKSLGRRSLKPPGPARGGLGVCQEAPRRARRIIVWYSIVQYSTVQYLYLYIYLYIYIYIYITSYIYIFIYMYIYLSLSLYIYIISLSLSLYIYICMRRINFWDHTNPTHLYQPLIDNLARFRKCI